jgi:dolichol-phosphate mannosyltransferase
MDRRVVDILCHLPERLRFVRGLRTFVGFNQCGVAYDRPARLLGQSKYSFRALVRLALDGLINFSTLPLKLITMAGLVSLGVALTLGVWLCGEARSNSALPLSLAVSVSALLVIAAAQFLGQGILGEYIRRIFLECKGRPTYLISRRQATQEKAPSSTVPVDGGGAWQSLLS